MKRDPGELDVSRVDPMTESAQAERARAHHVLVIDDEPTIRVALRRFFSRMGWQVAEAADGNAALDVLLQPNEPVEERASRFDMVLSDIRMPGLNGMQLYDRLKEARPDILPRLVFSTGDLAGTETAEFVRHSGCAVVQKPFMLEELREIAERLAAS